MKNITVKKLCDNSNIPAKLIRSVIRQIGGFDEFKERAQDVSNHGASGGFAGFTYYSDTVEFTKRNKKEILEYCETYADEIGESGTVEFVSNFNCFKNYKQHEIADGLYNPRSDYKTDVFNALAWFALEEVCRCYVDMMEGD